MRSRGVGGAALRSLHGEECKDGRPAVHGESLMLQAHGSPVRYQNFSVVERPGRLVLITGAASSDNMAYFPDLTPYTYFPGSPQGMVNIGWLDFEQAFPTGTTSQEFRTKLVRLCTQPVMQTRGVHFCDACKHFQLTEQELQDKAHAEGRLGPDIQEVHDAWNQAHQGVPPPFGSAEIHVPGKGDTVYAAPEMVAHYVIMHDYRPPERFIQAVLDCNE